MDHALELTTRFSAISTGAGGRKRLSPAAAASLGAAHLRYIDRPKAVLERAWAGVPGSTPAEVREALRERMQQRSQEGGLAGARVAEKMVVSLPNSWGPEARQEALERIVKHLAPPGSEAMAYAVTHGDRPGNRHLHVLAVDGLESIEAARARRPDAKRVRRGQVIRLRDLGRPRELRGELAAILNQVAEARGLEGVEWRSFETRGIVQEPTTHEGPRRRAIAEKQGEQTPRALENERRRQQRAQPVQDDLEGFLVTGGGTPLDLDTLEAPQEALQGPSGTDRRPLAPSASQQPPAPPGASRRRDAVRDAGVLARAFEIARRFIRSRREPQREKSRDDRER